MTDEEDIINCRACGATVMPWEPTCPGCGANLHADPRPTCPECGYPVNEDESCCSLLEEPVEEDDEWDPWAIDEPDK